MVFKNATGASTNKVCTAGTGTTASLVSAACNGISVKVSVGGFTAATTEVDNHSLAINTAEEVTVTITYATGSAVADGNFTVNFGDITLTYSSLDESNGGVVTPTNPTAGVFTLSNDFDNSGTVSTGDTVTINGESFAVLPSVTRSTNISLIAQQNITITARPRQGASAGTIAFADTDYWQTEVVGDSEYPTTFDYVEGYSDNETIYNENSNLYQYIEAYEDYLETLGLTGVSVTIPKPSDLYSDLSDGCLYDFEGISCGKALPNGALESTDKGFWLDYIFEIQSGGHVFTVEKITSDNIEIAAGYGGVSGIRPVITIPSSLLGL